MSWYLLFSITSYANIGIARESNIEWKPFKNGGINKPGLEENTKQREPKKMEGEEETGHVSTVPEKVMKTALPPITALPALNQLFLESSTSRPSGDGQRDDSTWKIDRTSLLLVPRRAFFLATSREEKM